MFLKKEDLGSSMYGYQIEQITEGDDTRIDIALQAAEEEVRSYLTQNYKKQWQDGRLQYDAEAILTAVDEERNQLLVKMTVVIAKYWIIELCNADLIYEQAKERYDRAIKWLKDLASGDVNLSTLPLINTEETTQEPFGFGSRTKFNHE